jgi:hypothetical protein
MKIPAYRRHIDVVVASEDDDDNDIDIPQVYISIYFRWVVFFQYWLWLKLILVRKTKSSTLLFNIRSAFKQGHNWPSHSSYMNWNTNFIYVISFICVLTNLVRWSLFLELVNQWYIIFCISWLLYLSAPTLW